jgi:hypothetical protein
MQENPDPTPEPERLHGIQQNVAPNASILSPPIQNHITETNPTATRFSAGTQPPPRVVTPAPRRVSVKLLPLPQPPLRARTDARTNPNTQRATQLRSVLACVYAVSRQNQITTTVP